MSRRGGWNDLIREAGSKPATYTLFATEKPEKSIPLSRIRPRFRIDSRTVLVPGLNARWSERSRHCPIASTKYFIRNPQIKKQRTRASIIRTRTLKARFAYNAGFPRYPSRINAPRSPFRPLPPPRYLLIQQAKRSNRRDTALWCLLCCSRAVGKAVCYGEKFRECGKMRKRHGAVGQLKYATWPITGMIEGNVARRQSTGTERRMRRSMRSILIARRE